jgi:hypothetical protein
MQAQYRTWRGVMVSLMDAGTVQHAAWHHGRDSLQAARIAWMLRFVYAALCLAFTHVYLFVRSKPLDYVAASLASTRVQDSHRDLEAFIQWFNAKEGWHEPVDVGVFESFGRGVVATSNISQGELVMHIPTQIIVSRRQLESSGDELYPRLARAVEDDTLLLALWLVIEREKGLC